MSFAAKAARLVLVMLREGSRGPRLLEKEAAMLHHVELSKQAENVFGRSLRDAQGSLAAGRRLRQLADICASWQTRSRSPQLDCLPCIARLQYRNARASIGSNRSAGSAYLADFLAVLVHLVPGVGHDGGLVWRRLRQDSRRSGLCIAVSWLVGSGSKCKAVMDRPGIIMSFDFKGVSGAFENAHCVGWPGLSLGYGIVVGNECRTRAGAICGS